MAPVALNSIYTKIVADIAQRTRVFARFYRDQLILLLPTGWLVRCKERPRMIGPIVSVLASDDLVGKVNAVFKCRCLKCFRSWFRSTFHWASSSGVCGRLSRSLGELEGLPLLYRGWFTDLKMYRHSCLRLVCVNGEMGLVSGLSIWFYCFFFLR